MKLEFVIIAEAGILEAQAVMLCESIRQFGGRYAKEGIVVISPRPDRRPNVATLQRLENLNVKYIPLSLESPCPEYGTSFRVLAWAEYERMSAADILVGLDSDTVFLAEPDLDLGINDAAARPVDFTGMCSKGLEDPRDLYWQNLCSICGVDYNVLPYIVSTVDHQTVKASYNGGLVVVRRSCNIFQRAAVFFLKSVEAGFKPYANEGIRVEAGHGQVSLEGSEYWGSSQACLSLAIWGANLTLRTLPSGHNFPLHHYEALLPEIESGRLGTLTHIHYHNMLTDTSTEALGFIDYLGLPVTGIAWLKEHAIIMQRNLKEILEPKVCHARSSMEDLLANGTIPAQVLELDGLLRDFAADFREFENGNAERLSKMILPRLQLTIDSIRELEIQTVELKQLVCTRDLELASSREELENIYSSNGWRFLTKCYKLRDTFRNIIRK